MCRSLSGLLVALGLLCSAGQAHAQISGRVVDAASQQPVAFAGVALLDSAGVVVAQVVTSPEGRFIVTPRSAGGEFQGEFSLQVVALGYVASPEQVVEYVGDGVYLEIALAPAPIETDGLTVTVEARNPALENFGFYQRLRTGRGTFVTPEDLEGRVLVRASEMLRRVPSVDVRRGEPLFIRNQGGIGGSSGGCTPALYLDGFPVRQGGAQTGRLSQLSFDDVMPPPEQILALETYPGGASVPAQWAGAGTLCGVIVVWTKRS